jgi:hypothetical protein
MKAREHIRGQERILTVLNRKTDNMVLEEINQSKDLFSNHPRKIDSKWLGSWLHRGHEHGILTNRKWGIRHGPTGRLSSVLHNFQDRRHSKRLTFMPERLKTWYFGKLANQFLDIPVLEDGFIRYK